MPHPRGRRNPDKKFQRRVRGWIFSHTYHDNKIDENVCLTTKSEIKTFMKTDDGLPNYWIPEVFRGLVTDGIELWETEVCWCGAKLRPQAITCLVCEAIHNFPLTDSRGRGALQR